MRRIFYRPIIKGCIFLILAFAFVAVATTRTRGMYLSVGAGGIPASDTRYGDRKFVAGAMAELIIVVRQTDSWPATSRKNDTVPEWPQGLSIHVGTVDGTDHPEWIPEMQIHPFFDKNQSKHEAYNFVFTVPTAAAGERISISASFEHPLYGHLETVIPDEIHVVPVRNAKDQDNIFSTQIRYLFLAGNYSQVLTRADSLIALGYSSFNGLYDATRASEILGNYSAAIRYMDLNMSTNGAFCVRAGSDEPEDNPHGTAPEEIRQTRAAQNQAEYQVKRTMYLQKIEEQKQQQK